MYSIINNNLYILITYDNHPEKDAVAICKFCGKALCHDCASELNNGIDCKGKCEKEIEFLNELIQKDKSRYNKAAQSFYVNSIMCIFMGLIFVGLRFFTEMEELKPFTLIIGGGLILSGILVGVFGSKFKK
ncbi:hypothetical protein [Clostridium sp. ZS2-4]|uniref:hypothetical protein n=1 Tax=Clostridium sp. ZS2-4 TaxID=2987703 RepID=UPI00227D5EE3|nr:hypothetical protein [Clostridium sp. ZS2-4]MCY6356195.1 hypothetical protein [Clostridium sp. ZS2-4]